MAYNAVRGHFTIHIGLAGQLERSPTIDETSPTIMKCTYGFIGRSLVRFQMVSLEFFIDIIFPIALRPWGRLSL